MTQIFIAGLKAITEAAINQGEKLPDDFFGDLISEKERRIEDLKKEIAEIEELRLKNNEQNTRTIAGKPPQAVPGLKPGYHFEEGLDDHGNKVQTAVEDNYD